MATTKENSVSTYIKERHTQEECVGFIDGYEKAVQDFEKIFYSMISIAPTINSEYYKQEFEKLK